MATRKRTAPPGPPPDVEAVLTSLRSLATEHTLLGMARYAIPSEHAFGVAVGDIKAVAKGIGRDQALAAALWDTGVYEARMLVAFIGEPATLTPTQMDRWLVETDNWAVCDTLCFHLYDRTPHRFACVEAWADRPEEFVKRGAFALLASVALHDKKAPDDAFLRCLPLAERAATDDRNFVKKGVSWALRGVGRRNTALHEACLAVAERLEGAPSTAARWVGRDTRKELTSAAVRARVAGRASP